MNMYLISNMYPTINSPGYGSFVKNICDDLNKRGIYLKFKSVIKGRNKSKMSKLLKYIMFYLSIIFHFFRKYDFIYIHFPNQAIPLLRILFKIKKVNIIVNYHGEDLVYSENGYERTLGKMTEDFCRNYATGIVVPSEYFKNIVKDREIIQPDSIIVSPSGGINPAYFFPDAKKTWFNSSKEIHLGYVGRLEKEKGIIEYLETCRILLSKGINFKGTIIGYGTLLDYVRDFIIKYKLESKIQIINGMSQSQLGHYYRKFDLLIFSSSARTGESLGLTGIESMACGTPVIGSNIGGISSYLIDSENGFSVPVNNVEEIIKAIDKYIGLSIEKKKWMSNNSIATGKKYYNHLVCEKLFEDFNKLISP